MRIAFIWDWNNDPIQCMTWKDGLSAAMRILSKKYEVRMFTLGKHEGVMDHAYFPFYMYKGEDMKASADLEEAVRAFAPDVILHFADLTRPNARPLSLLGIPMALCFAGGDTAGVTGQYFDLIFIESEVYRARLEVRGHEVITAFGTNTELYTPIRLRKHFDVAFPATYCDWKRHRLFSDATEGFRAVAAGFMYDVQERDCYEYPQEHGVLTFPHISAEALKYLYAASKTCVITSRADGGSQRTVLEAMAMNVPVIVMSDSDKTSEYILDAQREGYDVGAVVDPNQQDIHRAVDEWRERGSNAREYILKHWSHEVYADNLERGLKTLCA